MGISFLSCHNDIPAVVSREISKVVAEKRCLIVMRMRADFAVFASEKISTSQEARNVR
jgi:hypothetical protein